jgi:hypothetical protein
MPTLSALDVGQRMVTGGLVLATGYLATINVIAIADLSQWALVRPFPAAGHGCAGWRCFGCLGICLACGAAHCVRKTPIVLPCGHQNGLLFCRVSLLSMRHNRGNRRICESSGLP